MTRDEQLRFIHMKLEQVKAKVSGMILINQVPEDWQPPQLCMLMAEELKPTPKEIIVRNIS